MGMVLRELVVCWVVQAGMTKRPAPWGIGRSFRSGQGELLYAVVIPVGLAG